MSFTPFESFDTIQRQWEDLLSVCSVDTLYLTPQWQKIWWENYGADREMAGFFIEDPDDEGSILAIASLSRQNGVASLLGSPETFDYNDFMIRPGYEAEFFPKLLRRLDSQGMARLELYSLRESSPTLEFLPDMARSSGYAVEVSQEDVAPGLDLPASWDEYLSLLSRKDRHELRRKFRRLDGLDQWRWYVLASEDEVADRLGDFLRLMRMSDPEKSQFMTPRREKFFREMARRTAQLGLIKLFFMEVNGKLAASSICFDYGPTRLLYNSGHDPEFRYYSVGLLLNALCLRDAIDQGKAYFDFLRGSEPYKYHLGGRNRTLYQMVVTRN